jgi:hypothetical protein
MTEGRKNILIGTLRTGSLVLGTVFVLLGIYRGEHLEVLGKAVRICLECIGIG